MLRKYLGFAAASAVAVGLFASPAHATFSVVGADTSTRDVGGALTTCGNLPLGDATKLQEQVYKAAVGKGVIHGQSLYFDNRRNEMAAILASGRTPTAIVKKLKQVNREGRERTSASLYEKPLTGFGFKGHDLLERRQYLIASTRTDGAAWTGSNDDELLGTPRARKHTTARNLADSRFRATLGGNTLTNEMVVDNMAAQWTYSDLTDVDTVIERVIGLAPNTVNIPGIRKHDLAERLFLSQMAGGNRINGAIQGDKRCTPGGRTSNLGWVRVDKANGTVPINLRFTDTAKDARIGLALMYWTCRMTNLPSDCVRSAGNATAPTANADARVAGIS